MRKICLKISLFELSISEHYFSIYIIIVGIWDDLGSYPIFGFRVDKYNVTIHFFGIPIMIPLKPRVR